MWQRKFFFTKKENLKEIWENLKKNCGFWPIYRTTLIRSCLSMFKHWLWNDIYSHCVKSVQIGSFFWSLLSCIRTEYGVNLRVQSEYRRIRTEKFPHLDTFHAVSNTLLTSWVFFPPLQQKSFTIFSSKSKFPNT